MEIPGTKRFIPEGFELDTTMSKPNMSMKPANLKYPSPSVEYLCANRQTKKKIKGTEMNEGRYFQRPLPVTKSVSGYSN